MDEPVYELQEVAMNVGVIRVGAALRRYRVRQHWPLSVIVPHKTYRGVASVDNRPHYFDFYVCAAKARAEGGYTALLNLHSLHIPVREDIGKSGYCTYAMVEYWDSGVHSNDNVVNIVADRHDRSDRQTAWNVLHDAFYGPRQ